MHKEVYPMRRKALASILAVAAGPNDAGAKCHPPGQTVNEPGCK